MKFIALVIIASSEYEESLKTVAKNAGASGATIIQARGTGNEEKKSFFSLTFEGNQIVLLYILEEKMSKSILKAIKKEIEDKKSDCIAFTTPISHIVGLQDNVIKKFEENIISEEIL